MASPLECLGFLGAGEREGAEAVARLALAQGEAMALPGGERYVVWRPGEGIEIWIGVDATDAAVCLIPFFAGQSRQRLSVCGVVERPGRPFETMANAWAGSLEGPSEDAFPLAFDLADSRRAVGRLRFDAPVDVQLAGFVHRLDCFEDAAALRGARGTAEEVRTFLPVGLWSPSGCGEVGPEAVVRGEAVLASTRTNPVTQVPFLHLVVRTLGMDLDLVVDTDDAPQGVRVGQVVDAQALLSGRLMETGAG